MPSIQRFKQLMRKYDKQMPLVHRILPNVEEYVRFKKPLTEVKHRIGKSSQRFNIENWNHTSELCVGRYVAAEDTEYGSLKGSFSWGVWWKHHNVGAYRIHDRFGNLLVYRFDILKHVKLWSNEDNDMIEFQDMIVDLWMWPDENGQIDREETSVDDLDELDTARESGAVTIAECENIATVTSDLLWNPDKYSKMVDNAIDDAMKRAVGLADLQHKFVQE
jgi:hypothetical protein